MSDIVNLQQNKGFVDFLINAHAGVSLELATFTQKLLNEFFILEPIYNQKLNKQSDSLMEIIWY